MGPRLFRRGNRINAAQSSHTGGIFNGATSFQTWKWENSEANRSGKNTLQWGHVFSDVEIEITVGGVSHGAALQWGHVFSDVEMLQRLLGVLRRCELQWGHVFSDVEIASRMMGCRRRCMASMGPRLFRRGNVFSAFGPVIASPASMGPRLFRRGNGRLRLYQRPRARRFNGATSFQTWKSGLR